MRNFIGLLIQFEPVPVESTALSVDGNGFFHSAESLPAPADFHSVRFEIAALHNFEWNG